MRLPRPSLRLPRPDLDRREWMLLAGLLVAGLGLRLWSFRYGLPWVYNRDEEEHFVPHAVEMFGGSLNPGYFENPPALTYLFYAVYKVRFTAGFPFGGGGDFVRGFRNDPTAAFETARIVVAVLGTMTIAAAAWAGSRWWNRRAGFVAAALVAFCFLPAFYSKFALNDAVTLLPVTAAMVALLLVLERGRLVHFALAGAAIGAAVAVKYTAGALLVPLAIAAAIRVRDERAQWRPALLGLAAAGAAFAVVFLVLNPYAAIDFSEFRSQVGGQSATAGGSAKLGQADVPGWLYYAWTLTWGLGWVPALLAVAGAVLLVRENPRRAVVLIAFPILLFAFLGAQQRYFARWFLPAYPALILLAAYAAARISAARRPVVLWALAAVMVAQGVAANVRVDSLLARTDTRELARQWLIENLPPSDAVVVEPFVPSGWTPGDLREWEVRRPFQAYTKRLSPALVDRYRARGYCTVVVGSHQKGRGLKAGLAGARAYYDRLDRESEEVVRFLPWRAGADPPGFSFDMSFNNHPRQHARPGPEVEVHRLRDCE